jgi:hypothetical protein
MLKIYKISQNVNGFDDDFEVYDSVVVIAKNEKDARECHPYYEWANYDAANWANHEDVKVELIGVAETNQKRGVINTSYKKE